TSQSQLQREIARDGPARGEVHAGGGTNYVDMCVETLVRDGIDMNRGRLAQLNAATFGFFDASCNFQRGRIGKLGNGDSRPGAIPCTKWGGAIRRLPMIL